MDSKSYTNGIVTTPRPETLVVRQILALILQHTVPHHNFNSEWIYGPWRRE
ncbi:MAG: hypothetical protein R3C49_12740 [Planctomycetaceae bacterium]